MESKKSRNYRKEYDNYQGKESQKKARASRNTARRRAVKEGKASPPKPGNRGNPQGVKEVDHKDGNPRNNAKGNTRTISRRENRSYPRTKTARKK
jgi:hypothetical protein